MANALKIKTCKQFQKLCRENFFDAAELMNSIEGNSRVEILDADNLLNYNDGHLNLRFNGEDFDETFLFIDGTYEGSSYVE